MSPYDTRFFSWFALGGDDKTLQSQSLRVGYRTNVNYMNKILIQDLVELIWWGKIFSDF